MRSTVAAMAYTLISTSAEGIHLQRDLNRHQLLLALDAAQELFPGVAGGLSSEDLASKIDNDGFFLPEGSLNFAVFLMDVTPRRVTPVTLATEGFFTLVARIAKSKEDRTGKLMVFPHLDPGQVVEYARMTLGSMAENCEPKEKEKTNVRIGQMLEVLRKQIQRLADGGMFSIEPFFCIFKPRVQAVEDVGEQPA